MVETYRLHYFPESGNSYKLAQMLTLCGQPFELVWTDFAARVTWSEEWRRKVNPMGEIPVLEENGRRLTQTGPILLHLGEKFGRLIGGREARFEVLRWLFWDNQKMSGYMATYRFMRTFSEGADPAVMAFFRRRIDDFLGILEHRFGEQPFVAGADVTIADISMCAYLSYPEDEIGYDLGRSYPHVRSWLNRLAGIPGWRSPYDLLPGQRLPRFDQNTLGDTTAA
ncbi:MAG TPA: glutathione S-transferase family protein [Burkholderiaceae bacterium]|nr:glutathione S-transferase family protein [Burkholderiaceae bacterium]